MHGLANELLCLLGILRSYFGSILAKLSAATISPIAMRASASINVPPCGVDDDITNLEFRITIKIIGCFGA